MMDEASQGSLLGMQGSEAQSALAVTGTVREESEGSTLRNPEVPALVQHWIDGWPVYVAATAAAEKAVADLRGQEKALGHRDSSAWAWSPMGRDSLAALAASAMGALTDYARRSLCGDDDSVFSNYTARLMIEECGCLKESDKPNFRAYWDALSERFGRGRGHELQLVQAAKRVREKLNIYEEYEQGRLRWQQAPKMERGGVTFDLRYRWAERSYSGGMYELTYSCCEGVSALMGDLETILGASIGANTHRNHFGRNRSQKISLPYRVDVGGWRWSLFKDTTKLWMPQETAIALRARLDDLSSGKNPCS